MEEKNIIQIFKEARENYEPLIRTHIKLYGENSAFLVSESYRSCYHDDYASFTYYSNITGEYFEDEWTTAGACFPYDCYKTKEFNDAKEEDLIDIGIYNSKYIIPETLLKYDDSLFVFALQCKKAPYVEVFSGKKMKGCKGIAIDSYKHRFGGEYYIVYFPEEDRFASISVKNLKLDREFIDKVNNCWRNAREEEMRINHRLRSLNANDILESLYPENYREYVIDLQNRWRDITLGITPNLLTWVREHFTDVTEEFEIRRIAEKIAAKKRNQYAY